MKKSLLFIGCILFYINGVFGQGGWITDEEMQFKINAPQGYTQKQIREGSDKVLTLMSSDQNVMIRVRAMPATDQFTPEFLQQAFEQNMIQGANRIMNENGDLHGIPALASAYTWNVDNNEAVLGTYYIVQNGFAYIVWTAIPRNLIQQRSAESDAITNSFELLQPELSSTGGGLLSGIGSVESSTSSAGGTSSPPPPALKPKSSIYWEMVSDDACVEHLFPKSYKQTSAEQGQSIWEDGAGIKMIKQTIIKQGDFKSFISSQLESIQNQGAQLGGNGYSKVNDLEVFQYFYEYGSTLFAYCTVENNNVYYMVGFVGDKTLSRNITQFSNDIKMSFKKAACPGGM